MKNILKILTLTTMCYSMPLLSACSFIRSESSDAVGIADVISEQDENGNTIVTITFTDDDKDPVTFVLPKGEDGESGVGIKTIDYDTDEFGVVTITITLTNNDTPVTFTLSPGKSINDVRVELDEDGNTVIYFVDSDGNLLDPITVYKGNTGDSGVGIVSIDGDYHIDGSVTLYITLTDGNFYTVEVPAPRQGRGISSIVSSSSNGEYILTITYSDGTSDTVSFDAPPSWTTGSAKPGDDFGNNGDYFFDIEHDIIYIKQGGTWVIVVNFNTDSTTYTVTFNLNDSTSEPATFVTGTSTYSGINRGETFYSMNYTVPVPYRSSYTFEGWSTSKTPNVTNGVFTDLTPILSDMTLYAIWNN